ncbi:PREDICTED: macrosialin [Chinchilla lanigera]|uniref:Macrosialin n=1 Tax=Chinchilla lanigera TaxID=34839 RepID=A0A8C2VNB6_CHILA|nr:PREDICTED: macrosialin [Chinchilla lanigera]
MRLAVLLLVSLGLLTAQGTEIHWPHKKSATLLPSFTVTPTATKTVRPTTSHGPTTTSHGNTTVHPTSNSTATTAGPTTDTHSTAATTSPGNATRHSTTSNGTATSPRFLTSSPTLGPLPPSPSPSPGSKEAIGDYTWTNGSQPCVQLQAQIQIRVLYPTKGGGEAWGISVLNPNKTKAQGGCEGGHTHVLLSFPYGHLSFGFKQDLQQSRSVVYLNYAAVEYNVSFPQAAQWTFAAQNSSLRDLQAPLGQSFSCRNASILLSPVFHLDLLSLRLQAAQLPHTGVFGPSFSCPGDQSIMLPLIIGLTLLGLLALVLAAFCIIQRRPSAYQAL